MSGVRAAQPALLPRALGDLWRLPDRLPFRLRFFFRAAFTLLTLATLALALSVLQDEKQRSHRVYAEGLRKTQAQIVARLRHPTGQLALLNAGVLQQPPTPVRPLALPFTAIDFDDRGKALQAVEMAGCALQYPSTATLCAGVGSNPYAGAFVYGVATLRAGPLVAHQTGDLDLANAHRVQVELRARGQAQRWVAAYELAADGRGRLIGFDAAQPMVPGVKALRDFRGWLWQEARCEDAAAPPDTCLRRTTLTLRLPADALRDTLGVPSTPRTGAPLPPWPPADLDRMTLHLRLLPPGDGPALFDSDEPGAVAPFSLAELQGLLMPGETLRVRRAGQQQDLVTLTGRAAGDATISPWLGALIRRLPVEGFDAPLHADTMLATPQGRYDVVLEGDIRSVNLALAAVATRLSGFVGAMLLAVLLTWLAIELRIIRRVTLLTRRAQAVRMGMRQDDGLATLDLSDLRSRDELGVLAQGLQDLLQRVNEDMRREHIRAQQEKDQWHAVGHEIMSPLQSLMALHGQPGDPAERYISRMQQAVRVLYGQASPSEAFASTQLGALQALDLDAFLGHVAANAAYLGIDNVRYDSAGQPQPARADEYALEDVIGHVLRNAARHRTPGTPITLTLSAHERELQVRLHNQGPPIDEALRERIFEYGVSGTEPAADGPDDSDAPSHRGQGLFVARTYMAKMGGTITAHNEAGGVSFVLSLPRAST